MGKTSKKTKSPPPPAKCMQCGKAGCTTRCGGCRLVQYCGRDCQKADWKEHKLRCQAMKAERLASILSKTRYPSLAHAAYSGDLKIVRALVEAGADVREPIEGGWTAAGLAAQQGRLDVLTYLAEHGADLDAADDQGQTPVLLAAMRGRIAFATLRFLVANGAAVHRPDNRGRSPIYVAAEEGGLESLRLLEENGGDINKQTHTGSSPVMAACGKGKLDIVRFLSDKGAHLTHVKETGATPVWMACQTGHLRVVKFLSEKGCSLEQANNDSCTPLIVAAQQGFAELVSYLAGKGCDVNAQDSSGVTASHFAAQYGKIDVLRALHAEGANLDQVNNKLETPVFAISAQAPGYLAIDTLKYLSRRGVDLNRVVRMASLREAFICSGKPDVACVLEQILAAGGWRSHAAELRYRHCLIRQRVSATYATLPAGDPDRELYHLVYGRNNVDAPVEIAESVEAIRSMSVTELKAAAKERGVSLKGCLEKSEIVAAVLLAAEAGEMKVLPDAVFAIVCRFLET